MAATPNSNYSSSPSPSTHSTYELCRDDSPVYGPGLYDLDSNDEIPDIATLRVTDNEEDSFHSPPPPPQSQPKTQTPHQSSSNQKRHKKMLDIANKIEPESMTLAWMFMGIYVRKSPVAETLRTGFNLKPSLKEVFEIQSEIIVEFNKAMRGLINHGSYYKSSGSNFCFVNFMRDMMEIPELAMIRMRRVLAECKCCELHQTRRPLCQEKKRQPDYDMFANPENDCKCTCRHLMRKLESALLGEHPLEVKGQLWERSL